MLFDYFVYCCKEWWGEFKIFLKYIYTLIDFFLDYLNIFLAKHNIIKVLTAYRIYYMDVPVSIIIVYGKLYRHYDEIAAAVENDNALKHISDNIHLYDLRIVSEYSYIKSFFKSTSLKNSKNL